MLAWEAGAGRGHVLTLGTMARALSPRFTLDAALRKLDHARELTAICELVFRGPALPYRKGRQDTVRSVATATWGDYLGDIGFDDPDFIARQVNWWVRLMKERAYRLLVADYAPCAMLAARCLGIPTIAVGTGFGLPPGTLARFPPFVPDEDAVRLHDEAEMVDGINRGLRSSGLPRLTALPEIYLCEQQIVRTPPPLDPYCADRTDPPIALHPLPLVQGLEARGSAILLYLSAGPPDGGGLPEACVATRLPVMAYAPALDEPARRRLEASGATVFHAPLPPEVIARQCMLLVHHGQPGTALLGLATGLPQAALPLHGEQRFHTLALERMVGPLNLENLPQNQWADFLREQALSVTVHDRMKAARDTLAPFFRQDHAALLCDRLRLVAC